MERPTHDLAVVHLTPAHKRLWGTLLVLGALAWCWPAPSATLDYEVAQATRAASTPWPFVLLGDDTGALGAPQRLSLPEVGNEWTSPGPMPTSGFIVAWARLKGDFAATAIGSVSPDGSTWTEIVRTGANANRSVPHVNVMLPVPAGYHFKLRLEGARGGGLEIVEDRGGHWFPLGADASGS